MKATVTTRITIDSSLSNVFAYLIDLKYTHLWNPQIKSVSSTAKLQLNSSYHTVSKILGVTVEAKNYVTKFNQNKELELENNTGTVHYSVNFKLSSITENSIQLKCTTTVSSENKAFAFSAPVLKLLARRELQTDLQALKIVVENQMKPMDYLAPDSNTE